MNRRGARLKSPGDIRRELGRVYRAARAGDLTPIDAQRLAAVLNATLRAAEVVDVADELRRLRADVDALQGAGK